MEIKNQFAFSLVFLAHQQQNQHDTFFNLSHKDLMSKQAQKI